MPLLNILIANDYISCFSSDPDSSDSFSELPESAANGTDAVFSILSDFLSNLDALKNGRKNVNVNLILDRDFTGYYYFKLPPVGKKKMARIIEFELEDTLLDSSEDHFFGYFWQKTEKTAAEVGVYTVNKEFLNGLADICRNSGLELKGVFPLNSLMDISFRESAPSRNCIYVAPEENFARIFVYRQGFLIDVSTILFADFQDADEEPEARLQARLDLINQKIAVISIMNSYDYEVILEKKTLSAVKVNDDQRLEITEPPEHIETELGFSRVALEDLTVPSIMNKARRINLLKSNVLIAKELKKHAKPLVLSASVIIVCLIMYIGLTVYSGVKNHLRYEKLNQGYITHIHKYLKKGISKANALFIIKGKVKDLKAQTERNRKFAKREYGTLTLLKEFSFFKEKVPSFLLDNLYLTDNIIRMNGQVDSAVDFERIKEQLQRMFPQTTHNLSYNQESEGEKALRFKVTIRKTASSSS